MGEAHRSNGNGDAARKCYYRAIDAGRQDGVVESAEPLAWNNLGLLEIATGKAKHARDYASAEEEAHRFGIFTQNMEVLAEMQALLPHDILLEITIVHVVVEARWLQISPDA